MNIPLSKLVIIFLAIFFVFCLFLTQKSVSIQYLNTIVTYNTNERTIKDLLQSNQYLINVNQMNQDILKKPLMEGMVIEILSNQSLRQVSP
jgi:predicted PurR-regulated permease PerM